MNIVAGILFILLVMACVKLYRMDDIILNLRLLHHGQPKVNVPGSIQGYGRPTANMHLIYNGILIGTQYTDLQHIENSVISPKLYICTDHTPGYMAWQSVSAD